MIIKKDNYAIQAERARNQFVKENQEKLIQKFNLKADEVYLYVGFMDMTFLIERRSGFIKKTVDNLSFTEESNYSTTLSVFDYLCLSREDRQLSGKWVSMQEMGNMTHANMLEGRGDMYAREAVLFAEHKEELVKACEYLRGQRMPDGDVSYVLRTFDEFPLYFQLWDGDDEFPPQLRFLWDINSGQYVHYDSQFNIVKMFLNRIKELIGAK